MKFKRQCFWLKKLGEKWRKPKGRQSKLRVEKKGKWKRPSIGFGRDKTQRELVKIKGELKTPIIIKNLRDLNKLNPKRDVGFIASTVGTKKSNGILKKANEIGVKIVNRKIKNKKEK